MSTVHCLVSHKCDPFLRLDLLYTCILEHFCLKLVSFTKELHFNDNIHGITEVLLKPVYSWEISLNIFSAAHLNKTIVLLSLIYLAGALAALVRSWLFTLAGQRLVARIRKQASVLRNHKICLLILVRYF